MSLKYTTETFIEKAREVHGDKYNYDKVNYINCNTKIIIHCDKHGDFEQNPHKHLCGDGCPKCGIEKRSLSRILSTEEFILMAKEVHGNETYDYSKVDYTGCRNDVTIICDKHGEFQQNPNHHLQGEGCPKCGIEKRNNDSRLSTIDFIEKAREVHGNKYNYDKVNYINYNTKVTITCYKHGDFEQTPHSHISGKGCPSCTNSKLENEVRLYLEDKNIKFISQHSWDWLMYKEKQYVDFYIPEFNIAIECQGIQHFSNVELFDKTDPFELRLARDINKDKLCLEHGIQIYYYSNIKRTNKNFKYPYQVYEDIEELLKFATQSKAILTN